VAIVEKIADQSSIRGSQSVAFDKRQLYEYYGAPKPDGVTEKSLAITLPKNAVVKKYEVLITAATAHAVKAGDAGQVRTTPVSGGVSVVLDLGTPRTVSAIAAPEGVRIKSISTWIGTEFASPPKYSDTTGDNYVVLASEVRTERLQVIVSPSATTDALATEMLLVLPESPAGIELRIDGAAPAFSQPAAVDPGNSADLSTQSWNSESQRVVDLGPALAALTGNPLDESPVTFTATVTSRVPGKLDLALRPGGQDVLRIRRATFNGQPARDVAFESEGRQSLVLESIPADLTVNEVRFTVAGAAPAVRVVPPIGPEPPNPSFASFALSPERAACIRVPQEPRFAQLNGVRIALGGGSAGGEARVLLWKSKDLVDLTPAEPLENGASEPLTIGAAAEDWQTFSWKKPIPAPKDFVLWAVVTINRGDASLTFADASAGTGAERFLWGAPTGPWHDLPSALTSARGRIRAIGQPKPDAPFPPLRIELGANGPGTDVMPNVKGTAAVLTGPAVVAGPTTLVLTSHAPATVTVKDIDVISTS
jgi:hypothetical protein